MAAGLAAFHVIDVVYSIIIESIDEVYFGAQALLEYSRTLLLPIIYWSVFGHQLTFSNLLPFFSFEMTLGDCLSALKTGVVSNIYNHVL